MMSISDRFRMSKKPRNITKTSGCNDNPSFIEPKKLFLIALAFLLMGIFIGRAGYALQQAGIIGRPFVFGGFHYHHWMLALLVLFILFPSAFYYHERNQKIFGIIVIAIAFFAGLFIDGIIYPDSFMFFT